MEREAEAYDADKARSRKAVKRRKQRGGRKGGKRRDQEERERGERIGERKRACVCGSVCECVCVHCGEPRRHASGDTMRGRAKYIERERERERASGAASTAEREKARVRAPWAMSSRQASGVRAVRCSLALTSARSHRWGAIVEGEKRREREREKEREEESSESCTGESNFSERFKLWSIGKEALALS